MVALEVKTVPKDDIKPPALGFSYCPSGLISRTKESDHSLAIVFCFQVNLISFIIKLFSQVSGENHSNKPILKDVLNESETVNTIH